MSGVHDDLVTLLRRCIYQSRATYVPGTPENYPAAELRGLSILDAERVEAELSRLREQITELLQQESFMERKMAAQREDIERLAARVEAAEARCAAMEECDCIPFAFSSKACPKCGRRGVVSDKTVSQFLIERNEFEARCARLQQALAGLESAVRILDVMLREPAAEAAHLLSLLDTPADSHYRERPIEEDFYLDPRGEWVYRWSDERRVLKPADSQEDKT